MYLALFLCHLIQPRPSGEEGNCSYLLPFSHRGLGVTQFQQAERELNVWQAGVHKAAAGAPELGVEAAAGAEQGAEADIGVEQGVQHVQVTGIDESVSP